MSRRAAQLLLPACLLALLALAGPAQAATQYFVKIPNVPGESLADHAKDEIVANSFSWGMSVPVNRAATGGGTGRPAFSDFVFEHRVDRASPLLLRLATLGQHVRSVKVSIFDTGTGKAVNYLEYCLEDVIVSKIAVEGTALQGRPLETVSLNPGKFEERYTPSSPSGTPLPPVLWGWDLIGNKSIGFNNTCGTPG
jgi:type VI secretion system secreted protein Hcp